MSVLRILFIFAALVAVGMCLVHLRAETRQTGYLICQQWSEQQRLKRTCLDLQLELAQLRSLARLAAESERLQLQPCPPVLPGAVPLPVGVFDN